MLPHLFRIRHGEDLGRRPAMAELHRARRVLPERPAADMDRMVHAAPPALVPCSDGVWNAGCGTGASLTVFLPRGIRILFFLIITPLQIGILLFRNFHFLD